MNATVLSSVARMWVYTSGLLRAERLGRRRDERMPIVTSG